MGYAIHDGESFAVSVGVPLFYVRQNSAGAGYQPFLAVLNLGENCSNGVAACIGVQPKWQIEVGESQNWRIQQALFEVLKCLCLLLFPMPWNLVLEEVV